MAKFVRFFVRFLKITITQHIAQNVTNELRAVYDGQLDEK